MSAKARVQGILISVGMLGASIYSLWFFPKAVVPVAYLGGFLLGMVLMSESDEP